MVCMAFSALPGGHRGVEVAAQFLVMAIERGGQAEGEVALGEFLQPVRHGIDDEFLLLGQDGLCLLGP